jgi:hypothetical protein
MQKPRLWNNTLVDRRRLNTRLALLMVVLIPVPAILLRARLEPLQMLATVVAVVVGTGIAYPVWWRSKHHPYREDAREKRTRLVSVVCRTVAFLSLVGFMVSWVVGTDDSLWVALVFLAAGTTALIIGVEVEERWKRILGRRAAQLIGDGSRKNRAGFAGSRPCRKDTP